MNLFIYYSRCSTCQKAKKWLENNNISYEERNIIEETPTFQELEEWIERSGKEVKRFFNTSGLKYKELNLKEKLEEMTLEEKIKLLSSDGMLIKRPLFITEKEIYIGFREKEWENML
ncbi:MAG: arsenate reductase family protein [Clostridium sp.]|nr:arsenate reductase family protein [Clostridium sp.]